MSVSTVKICNMALALIGHKLITSSVLGTSTEAERHCSLAYPILKDELLQSHPWNFAEKRASLAALEDAPAFQFDYYYGLPSDCIRVLYLYDSNEDFRIEADRKIATNASPCQIVYTSRITDESLLSAGFVATLKYKLAEHLGGVLTDNNTKVGLMSSLAAESLRKAKLLDAQEGSAIKSKLKNAWPGRRNGWSDFKR